MKLNSQPILKTVLLTTGICLGAMFAMPAAEAALTMNGVRLNGISFKNAQWTTANTTPSTQSLTLKGGQLILQ